MDEAWLKLETALTGGRHYILRFAMTQDTATKRLGLRMYARTGGTWTMTETQGLIYTGNGNYLVNFTHPAGADAIRVEFLRSNSGQTYDGYNTPYTIDDFSISRLDTASKRTVTVCDEPGGGEEGLYRYGFNGQERSVEVNGNGNGYTAEFWEYDARLGRRWNLDPKGNAFLSPYAAFSNNPIWHSDQLGDTTAPQGSSTRDNPTAIGQKAHRALADYLIGLTLAGVGKWQTELVLTSGKRPDIVDNGPAKTVWELKPQSWVASLSYRNYKKGKAQLIDYVNEINSGGGFPTLTGTFTAGGSVTEQPILSGMQLLSAERDYLFTYTILNPNSGMIFYSAQKLDPQPVPTTVPESQPDNNPIKLIPIGVEASRPIPKPQPVRVPVRMGAGSIGRAGAWGLIMYGIYQFGKLTFETNQRNIKNMSKEEATYYSDALMNSN